MKTAVSNEELVIAVDVVLDVEGLATRLQLPPEAELLNYFDLKSYQDLGFKCATHLIWLLGDHYESLPSGDPRRERSGWFL